MGGFGGWGVGAGLLRLYAFWQAQFQECVNDSYDVWSSSVYIPYSHHYILHIKCRVKFEWGTLRYVGAVFVNIFTDTFNTATFIEKQLHISAVYDHRAINTVF
jgi:hypothetical protein